MFLKYHKKFLLISIILLILIVISLDIYISNSHQFVSKYTTQELLGIDLNFKYDVTKSYNLKSGEKIPQVEIRWNWTKAPHHTRNAQDIIVIQWTDHDKWLGTTENGTGGGGPAYETIKTQLMTQENLGLAYCGIPPLNNGSIRFELLPLPAGSINEVLPQIDVYYIHPERDLMGRWINSIVKYDSITK